MEGISLALNFLKHFHLNEFFVIFTNDLNAFGILMQQFAHSDPPLFVDNQLIQVKERRFVVLHPICPPAGIGLDDDMTLLLQ